MDVRIFEEVDLIDSFTRNRKSPNNNKAMMETINSFIRSTFVQGVFGF